MTADQMYADAACLMSYASGLAYTFSHAATFVDKIFRCAKPADLAFEQPMRVELLINGKTAKAPRLTIPQELLIMPDKVI